MKIVADTNVLFSFFRQNSSIRQLILNFECLDLFTPKFCIDELKKHKEIICNKSQLSDRGFEEVLNGLTIFVRVTAADEYAESIVEARQITPDPDDTDFFALALKLDCPIWTEDRLLKQQFRVKILSTKDLIRLLDLKKQPSA